MVALLAALLQAPAAAVLDTTLTVEGILVPVPATAASAETWAVQLFQPLMIGPVRTNVVELSGNPRQWRRLADRYVTAAGRLTAQPGSGRFSVRLQVQRLSEIKPPGLVERRVRISHTQSAIATLAVVPQALRLPPDASTPQEVRPAVLYTVNNIGTTDLEFYFPSSKAVCISVEPSRGRPWEDPTELRPGVAATVVIRIGLGFRRILPLPRAATPVPGIYTVRASLCGVPEYELTTKLEVIG
jgi:hypothetical protein